MSGDRFCIKCGRPIPASSTECVWCREVDASRPDAAGAGGAAAPPPTAFSPGQQIYQGPAGQFIPPPKRRLHPAAVVGLVLLGIVVLPFALLLGLLALCAATMAGSQLAPRLTGENQFFLLLAGGICLLLLIIFSVRSHRRAN